MQLTCKTFVSNVIVQVVERHLVDELDRIFNVMRLQEFDDSEIMEIANEDPSIRQVRAELKNTRRTLEAGERICRKYTARRDLSLDFTPTAEKKTKSSARPYNPNGNAAVAQKQTRKPLASTETLPVRQSMDEPSPRQASYKHDAVPPSLQRASSRATTGTVDTQASANISNPGGDGYAPPGFHRNRDSYIPNEYRSDSANGYYDSAPHVPPRPPPSIPPKQPDHGHDDGRKGQGIRNMFAGSRK
jgi:hypothetical protein